MIKKTIAALALSLSAGAAMAETGNISFAGSVNAGGTCPIDLVTPGGPSMPRIYMGDFRTKDFTAIGQKTSPIPFGLRITPDASCVIDPTHKAYVTFTPRYGAEQGGTLYALQSGVGHTSGLALEILDQAKVRVIPDTPSAPYNLSATAPTEMIFSASLNTTADQVTEGHVDSSVGFVVDIR